MNELSNIVTGLSLSPAWMWLIIAVVFAVIEGITLGLTTIWFAGGAVAAALISLVTDNLLIQFLAFILVSIVLLVVTRPLAVRQLNRKTVKTNLDAVIGTIGIAQSPIRELEPGTVRADGKEWTAVLAENAGEIREGERVKIHALSGVKLVVSGIGDGAAASSGSADAGEEHAGMSV